MGDRTFSAEDVLRIYREYLTESEMKTVEMFFEMEAMESMHRPWFCRKSPGNAGRFAGDSHVVYTWRDCCGVWAVCDEGFERRYQTSGWSDHCSQHYHQFGGR